MKQDTYGKPHSKPANAAPAWCRIMRRYLAGDARAGHYAMRSLGRWKSRYFPPQGINRDPS